MRMILVGFVATVGVIAAWPAYSADVNGWQGAKWGMKPNEVQRALKYPTTVADLAKKCPAPCKDGAALDLEDYDVDGQHFSVTFWFTKIDLRLSAVSMYAKPLPGMSIISYNKIEAILLKTYGVPQSVRRDSGRINIIWALPSTTIQLLSNTFDFMTVIYESRVAIGQGKL